MTKCLICGADDQTCAGTEPFDETKVVGLVSGPRLNTPHTFERGVGVRKRRKLLMPDKMRRSVQTK